MRLRQSKLGTVSTRSRFNSSCGDGGEVDSERLGSWVRRKRRCHTESVRGKSFSDVQPLLQNVCVRDAETAEGDEIRKSRLEGASAAADPLRISMTESILAWQIHNT